MEHIKDLFLKDHFATGIGIELLYIEQGRAIAELVVGDSHLNAGGVTQGGVIFTLADFAMAVAANSWGKLSFSIQNDIKYIAGSTKGERLVATAREISCSKHVSNYKCEVVNSKGETIAVSTALFYRKG